MKRSIVILMIALFSSILFSGTTGKIKGIVTDDNGEPLEGANIMVVGKTWGAETDEDGYYYIIGVRAGTYQLKCEYIGYSRKTIANLKVRVGLTSSQNFKLISEAIEMDEMIIEMFQDAKVEMDVTTSIRNVDMNDLSVQAVTEVSDVLQTMAGVKSDAEGDLHFRGGRAGEVNYTIDGISVGDPTGAKDAPVSINFANVESFNIQKGIPDAEYGDALSGSVNIVMKIGDQNKTSGHAKYSTDSFFGDSKLDYSRGEFSLSGPIPISGMEFKPTYYIATDFTLQNGFADSYRVDGDPVGDYFEYGDYDLTGFGFDIGQKRQNNFNLITKLGYDITQTAKLKVSFTKSKTHNYDYNYIYKYTPQTADEWISDVTVFNMNFTHTLNANSYYDLIFSYYNRKFENLPGGKTPDEFVLDTELDDFDPTYQDVLQNRGSIGSLPVRDGGDAEGYKDNNSNGYFDRETFVDANGNGNYDESEASSLIDANLNGEWDGDYLYDSNGNNRWDYWEAGQSYSGFDGDCLTTEIVEGYEDKNMNGHYDPDIYGVTGDEPYIDGDYFMNTGEPYVDFAIISQNFSPSVISPIYEKSNGAWDDTQTTLNIYTKTFLKSNDSLIINHGVQEFERLLAKHNRYYSITKVDSQTTVNSPDAIIVDGYVEAQDVYHRFYKVTYGIEAFADLETSYGDSLLVPGVNFTRNDNNLYFDEYEAYCTHRSFGSDNDPSTTNLGWSDGHGPNDSPSDYYEFVGSYATYKAPISVHGSMPSYTNTDFIVGYSTWQDLNPIPNNKFDYANSTFDGGINGDTWDDYNSNGLNDKATGFLLPDSYTAGIAYSKMDNTVIKLKGNYTNQINKLHMIKTGFELSFNELDYYVNTAPYMEYDTNLGVVDGDPYPSRGFEKIYYNYKPLEVAGYLQDQMEFEDLVVKAGLRFDMRRLDDVAADYYEEQYDAGKNGYEEPLERYIFALSPRLGISHAISENSKLFFSYGHLYQKPNYTQVFQPNMTSSTTPVFGNMNLGYQRNVQYELGVVNEFGDYLLDVTGYFKDIYDMINTYTPEDQEGRTVATIYENSDYGKSRGVEITLDRSLKEHYMWGLSYTLSYAYGKSSSETSNTDDEEISMKENPLIWDERHSLTSYMNVIYREGEELFGVPYMDNISLGINTDFGSGKPFTPDTRYYLPDTVLESDIQINSERMPWTSTTNLKFAKTFTFRKANKDSYGNLKFEFNVYNLFNKINVLDVYSDTGTWGSRSAAFYEENPELSNYSEIYNDESRIAERRHYRLSASYAW